MSALVECPRCQVLLREHPLHECPSCHRWANHLEPDGRCLDCNLHWTHCPEHGRLEHAGTNHQRVTAHQILTTLQQRQQQPSNVIVGPWGASASQ
ncbi:MAG TPA: hypothetical protein VG276_28090 [Actinomycetes bacterium]|jgi:hypothetical protein|nr:hypothetical protein [Actinomycetes bacterium]